MIQPQLLKRGAAAWFVELSGAPTSFACQAKRVARVNADETALEFGLPKLDVTKFFGGKGMAERMISGFLPHF